MKDRVLVAITGGIGSGKTTVSKIIKENGFKVFSCDEIYKEISKTDVFINRLKEVFPFAIDRNMQLNREKLAQLVFNDPIQLKKLNELSHPMVLSELKKRVEQEKGIVFCEVPLLFECNLQKKFDYVIIVLRPLSSRIDAVVGRDSTTVENVLKRIKNQFNYDNIQDLPANYFLIQNKKGIKDLNVQIENLIKSLTVKHKM